MRIATNMFKCNNTFPFLLKYVLLFKITETNNINAAMENLVYTVFWLNNVNAVVVMIKLYKINAVVCFLKVQHIPHSASVAEKQFITHSDKCNLRHVHIHKIILAKHLYQTSTHRLLQMTLCSQQQGMYFTFLRTFSINISYRLLTFYT